MNISQLYKRPKRKITSFQVTGQPVANSSVQSTDEDSYDTNYAIAKTNQSATTASHLLFTAMLEQMSHLYAQNEDQAKQLFQMVCAQLRHHGLLDGKKTLDELCSIRNQFKQVVDKLYLGNLNQISQGHRPQTTQSRLQLMLQPRLFHNEPVIHEFQTSRYESEYSEVKSLGRGAFGSVKAVRYKLDSQEYAIKKITFANDGQDEWYKVLREVKYLAQLTHNGVVRYYHSWLEHNYAGRLLQDEALPNQLVNPSIPRSAIEYSPQIGLQQLDIDYNNKDDESNDSIVFEQHGSNSHKTDLNNDRSQSSSYSNGNTPGMPMSCVHLYIQMELCDYTLTEWLSERNKKISDSKGTVSVNKDLNSKILKQILKAMNYIHGKDIIHRDVKPQNIFVIDHNKSHMATSGGDLDSLDIQIKIGDFGLSRSLSPSGAESPLTPHPGIFVPGGGDQEDLTLYTSGIGTTIYAAPEQLSGSQYNQKSDMYSLGLIMYELYEPFGTEFEKEKGAKSLTNNSNTSTISIKMASRGKSIYIEKLLCSNKDDRPTAQELLHSELFLSKDQIIDDLQCCLGKKDEEIKSKDIEIKHLKDDLNQRDLHIQELELQLELLTIKTSSDLEAANES